MSEGDSWRGDHGTGGLSVDRPTRIQELREAAGDGDGLPRSAGSMAPSRPAGNGTLGAGRATAVAEAPRDATASPHVSGPGRGTAATARPTGLIVGVAVGAVVLVAAGLLVLGGRANDTGAAPNGGPINVPTTALAPAPAAGASAPGPAGAPVSADETTKTMCKAATVYSLDDMLQLGRNVAADPDGFLKAYESLTASVPADQRPLVEQLGPLTRKAVVAGQRGVFMSDKAVQAWLLTLPKAELEGWVVAQQTLAPKLKATCAGA